MQCPLLAQSGYPSVVRRCPLLGVKRTSGESAPMSAFDPKRTFAGLRSAGLTCYHALFRAFGEAMRHSPARSATLSVCAIS
jgi:hypothetical protein